jgi:hypothetical protein
LLFQRAFAILSVMPTEVVSLRQKLNEIRDLCAAFFARVRDDLAKHGSTHLLGDGIWSHIGQQGQDHADGLRKSVGQLAAQITEAVKNSAFLNEADLAELGRNAKRIRAALRFRRYEFWPPTMLHNEDVPLGVQPAIQSEDEQIAITEAKAIADHAFKAIDDALDLLPASSPDATTDTAKLQAGAPSSTPKPPKQKPGPKTDVENCKKVADIVREHGANWKKDADALDEICEALDAAGIPKPSSWSRWPKKPPSWRRALENRPRLVVQALEYRLRKAKELSQK